MSDPQYQYVRLPDGSVGKFAANVSDADIHAQISKDFPAQMAAQAAANPFGGSAPHAPANMPLAHMEGLDNGMALIHGAVGAAKSIPNTIAGAAKLRNAIPRPLRVLAGDVAPNTSDSQVARLEQKPDGTAEAVGMGVGNAAQMMALPEVGATAIPRIAAQAVGTGALNKMQGGGFTEGAVAGGFGGAIGEGLRAVAPKIAQFAMGTRRVERANMDPGISILQDTSGIRPETINASARAKIAELGSANDAMAATYPGTVSIQPGIDVVDRNLSKGVATNSKGVSIPQMEKIRTNMTESPPISATTGQFTTVSDPNALPPLALSPNQTAIGAQNIKRGLRTDYISNFDPTMMKGSRKVANQAAGAIDGSLDSVLGPEYAANNERMSGLFAVTDAMKRRELDPSLIQKLAAKGAAHTGAAATALGGAALGYKEGGAPGAVIGGVAGFAGPELALSPETQMILARTAYSPTTRQIVLPAVKSAGLQLFPRSQ